MKLKIILTVNLDRDEDVPADEADDRKGVLHALREAFEEALDSVDIDGYDGGTIIKFEAKGTDACSTITA